MSDVAPTTAAPAPAAPPPAAPARASDFDTAMMSQPQGSMAGAMSALQATTAPVDLSAVNPADVEVPAVEGEQAEPQQPQLNENGEPVAEPIFGLAPDAILGALKEGRLPPELMALEVEVPGIPQRGADGRFLPASKTKMSLEEALGNGALRMRDYTQGTQQNAALARNLNTHAQQLQQVEAALSDPQRFEGYCENMGFVPQAQAMVTKEWGTAQQPNVQGFIESMYKLGHHRTFKLAVEQEVSRYRQLIDHFGGNSEDPNRRQAAQRYALDAEQREEAALLARIEAEKTKREFTIQQRRAQQQQMLRQRHQTPENPEVVQTVQQIHQTRDATFKQFGLDPNAYLPEPGRFGMQPGSRVEDLLKVFMRSQVQLNERNGVQMLVPELVRLAAQDVARELGPIMKTQPAPAPYKTPVLAAVPNVAPGVNSNGAAPPRLKQGRASDVDGYIESLRKANRRF